jgi:hypothetical protein
MRRIALGSFAVLAGLTLVLFAGCQRENSLRIVEFNGGKPFSSDLVDYGIINDPEGDPEEIEVTPDDFCKVQLQYVEIGLGLPTWTPYQANIEQVQLTYEAVPEVGEPIDELPPLVLPMSLAVLADRTGETPVEGQFNILPAWYKENYFDAGDQYILKITVKISGHDDATGEKVEATGVLQASVADYWDDPNSIGN